MTQEPEEETQTPINIQPTEDQTAGKWYPEDPDDDWDESLWEGVL